MATTSTMTQPLETQVSTVQRSLSPSLMSAETTGNERFPVFDDGTAPQLSESPDVTVPRTSLPSEYKWPSRRGSQKFREGRQPFLRGHRPKRSSVSEAINNLRHRRGSVSENAQELAQALRAPVSYKLIVLCIIWYMTSALTNTSSKSILIAFNKPVTLTILQFASVGVWCVVLATIAEVVPWLKVAIPALKNGLRYPTWDVIATALPLSIFQLLGHLLSSYATSKIPVSLVHTIKGLSPLFTVLAYRLLFRIRYARATYLSLVPLTMGVMLACSTDFSTNFWGIGASLAAAIVFVAQNIFSKKLFNESARAEAEGHANSSRKLDKLNLLCYCSVGAMMFSGPVWLYYEGMDIFRDLWDDGVLDLSARKGALDHRDLILEFVFNGIFHFWQNIMAFILLSMLSPVSYSVASLIKRVWVIVIAVIWFRSSTTRIQLIGIGLTMFGLYLYDRNSMEDAAERRAKSDHFHHKTTLLPVTESPDRKRSGESVLPHGIINEKLPEYISVNTIQERQGEGQVGGGGGGWLPPGTKQETTWVTGDQARK